jgi:hypothetical protein
MKKTFIRFGAVAMIGLALTACNNEAENKKAAEADTASIEQMVNDHLKMVDDSISKACDESVTAAATAKMEAMPKAAGHTTAHVAEAHHKVAKHTTAKPVVKKAEAPKNPQQARNGGAGTPVEAQKARNSDPAKSDAVNQHKRN